MSLFFPVVPVARKIQLTALRRDLIINAVALGLSDFERSVAVELSPNSDLSLQLAFTEVTSEV